jgi:hypothetical protein
MKAETRSEAKVKVEEKKTTVKAKAGVKAKKEAEKGIKARAGEKVKPSAKKEEKPPAEARKKPVLTAKTPAGTVKAGEKAQEKTQSFPKRYEEAEVQPAKALLRVFLPGSIPQEEEAPGSGFPGLPEEYGKNSLIVMAVDPVIVFIDWEIIPEDIAGEAGDLVLRVFDVTGIDFSGFNANCFMDIRADARVGRGFYALNMPGRDIIVEAGVLRPDGPFKGIIRSEGVSIPSLLTFDELGVARKLLESGIPVGY